MISRADMVEALVEYSDESGFKKYNEDVLSKMSDDEIEAAYLSVYEEEDT